MKRGYQLPLTLLLLASLMACGSNAPPAPEQTGSVPAPVDPATLELTLPPEPEPEPEAGTELPAWQAPELAIDQALWRTSLQEAESALAAGRLESQADNPGALDLYLGVLLSKPDHADALQGLEQTVIALTAQAARNMLAGRVRQAERDLQILAALRPEHEALDGLRSELALAQSAAQRVRKARSHLRAGRVWAPADDNAVASYREALALLPEFLPALDGLAQLESERLNRALAAAQDGDYSAAERLIGEARHIQPESSAIQDMDARIVELRQARTEALVAQGHAAVDALDLDLAARRLDEARQVSLQSQGLDELAQRIELAVHYGRHVPGQIFRDALAAGGDGPELVVIPHGQFRMGSPENERYRAENEDPIHDVTFARGFALARSEATVAEFRRFVESTGYRSLASRRGRSTVYDEKGGVMSEHVGVDWQRDHAGATASQDLPVVHVSFEDAEAYAAWISAQTGQRYRLPSEAEFEYALRAGSSSAYPWGAGPPPIVVGNLTGDGDRSRSGRRWSNAIRNYTDGHWGPGPVRSYPEEGFGTFDLIGNVSEWVQDCWHESYRRAPVDGSAWVNAGCEERVLRGASWASSLDRSRSAYRQATAAATTHARLGFRLVREI